MFVAGRVDFDKVTNPYRCVVGLGPAVPHGLHFLWVYLFSVEPTCFLKSRRVPNDFRSIMGFCVSDVLNFFMCLPGMEMYTGTNERIMYYPSPVIVDGYNAENVISLQAKSSVGHFRYLALVEEHFKVSKHDFMLTKDTELFLHLPDTSFLGLSFALKSDLNCHVQGVGQGTCFRQQFNIAHFRSIGMEYQFKSGEHTTFAVEISEEYFMKIAGSDPVLLDFMERTKATNYTLLSPRSIYGSGQMTRVLHTIMEMLEQGPLARLLLEAKTRELVWLSMERIKSVRFGKPILLTQEEEEIIRNVYYYMMKHLDQHISIAMAADTFGIHRQRLSKGFRALNGIDLSKLIFNERMELAHYLLAVQQKNVKETAALTGYPSQQNLSVIFKTHFGYSPSALLAGQSSALTKNRWKDNRMLAGDIP